MLKKLIILISLIFVSNSLLAVSLQNKDEKSYKISVKSNSSTMRATINGGTVKGSICNKCSVSVEGVGKVEANGSDQIIIKDGKIIKK